MQLKLAVVAGGKESTEIKKTATSVGPGMGETAPINSSHD